MVIIVNRRNYENTYQRLNDFEVRVGDETTDGGRGNSLCGGKSRPGRGEIIEIKCPKPLHGRYVSVLLPKDKPGYLTLCEVEVYRRIKKNI